MKHQILSKVQVFWALPTLQLSLLLVNPDPAQCQIIPDSSLGNENSRITPDSINSIPTDRIDGGAIRGSNLFHSFSEFNIGEGRGAYFSNPTGIDNIFNRVTGGNISQINGTLGVLGNANLFFINPNGIVFGPNARLDLRGSFLGSTANSILFENGLVFSARHPEAPPLLTVSIPIGLQLRTPSGEAPGALQVNGTGHSLDIANLISAPRSYPDLQLDGVNQADSGLQVPPGQTLALIGGEVAINGGILNANDGSIEISSVENGNIRIAPDHDGWSFDYHGVETWGNIRLSQQAFFNLNNRGNYSLFFHGDIISLDNNSLIIGNHTNISFQAAKLTEIKNSLILSYNYAETENINQNILDNSHNVGSENLAANMISKIDETPVKPGNITINTGDFRIFEGGLITTTFGGVAGGNLTISAREGAEVDGSFLAATTFGAGRGGDIQIDTKVLSVRNGGGILARTHSEAMTGNISVVATENVDIIGTAGTESASKLVVNVAPGATGNGGNLTIETGRLLVVDGGQIAANTAGAGNAGSLNVRSATQVEVIGTGATSEEFTGLFALVEEGATGHGGNLIVETDRLYVKQGGEIGAGTFGIGNGGELTLKATDIIEVAGTDLEGFPANIYTDTLNAGKGGNMTIETRHLSVRDGGQISAGTFGSGEGGNMQIRAAETISLAGWAPVIPNADNFLDATGTRFPSGLFASTSKDATGNGGNMTLETQELRVIDGAEISASTFGSGGAGNLTLKASASVILGENRNTTDTPIISLISADTRSSGRGGTLTIETPRLRVADGSQISTRTFGAGPGGALMVKAGESVTLDGTAADGTRSGLFVSVQPLATGAGGTLNLETQRLRVLDGALVEGSTLGDGDAGSVNIRARDTVEVIGATPVGASGLFASAVNGSGRGGDLSVVTNRLLIKDGGTIAASNFHSRNLLPPGTGPAGNIQITADSVLLENGASLNALAAVGDKGNMTVNARNIQLRQNSQLNTNAQGTATGGNITINTEILAALEDSNISANAQQSFGGSITINARGIFGAKFRNQQTPDSDITATSELGASFNGTVEINTPAVDPSSGLVTLPENFADIANLIDRDPCTSGGESSFTITGRGGLPPNPTDLLSSNLARSTWIDVSRFVVGLQPKPVQGDGETGGDRGAFLEWGWEWGPGDRNKGLPVSPSPRLPVSSPPSPRLPVSPCPLAPQPPCLFPPRLPISPRRAKALLRTG
ncbi:filamentous hemagglutinin N-terminal domain-containing protein [[Phormidium] sp. ETS-05]|uniref:two-partner secretion domain-containing protein n=1 Tax=[Phormidium] sp. ETS-05 TaxID=222819 RepID=UPI0018EEF859|nr:filamentous hemagglutinin N-terminal domain-containing protein [[Phormidium] sp. ETS-05]